MPVFARSRSAMLAVGGRLNLSAPWPLLGMLMIRVALAGAKRRLVVLLLGHRDAICVGWDCARGRVATVTTGLKPHLGGCPGLAPIQYVIMIISSFERGACLTTHQQMGFETCAEELSVNGYALLRLDELCQHQQHDVIPRAFDLAREELDWTAAEKTVPPSIDPAEDSSG
ncbi:hypothetical protein THAOC_31840, partial [Thalassiosira oceanica]